MELASKKCVPCEGGTLPLTPEVVGTMKTQVNPAWTVVENKKISRTFVLKDFPAALHLVDEVAKIAEAEGHHPDIEIHYNTVVLNLWTHAIGGLSENDFILAAKIDMI